MATKNKPAPRRAGIRSMKTVRRTRAEREAIVVKKLDALAESNPRAFDSLLKVLARLVVESEKEEN